MNKRFTQAFEELKAIGAPVFVNADNSAQNSFSISAEENGDELWADYYCQEYGVFGVSPRIENILNKHGLFSEWCNPGKLNVYVI